MIASARAFPRRLIVNSASIFAGEASARLATVLMAAVIARRFGSVALGEYGYALAITSVLLVIPDMGLHLFTVRELSVDKRQLGDLFWNVHCLKFILTGTVIVFALFFGQVIIAHNRRALFYVLMTRVLLQTFSQASMSIFKAFERMQYVGFQQTFNSLVVVAWTGAALILHASLPFVVAALAIGQLFETLIGWRIVRRRFSPGPLPAWNNKLLYAILVGCIPIGFTAILEALNLRIDVLVLGSFVSGRGLGEFQAAALFAVGWFLAASLILTVLFPKLSRILREQSAQGSAYILSLLKNSLLLTTLGSLVIWIAAPTLVPAFPLVFLNSILFYVFLAARRRFVCIGTLGIGFGIGVVLTFYLAAGYGAVGCAVADVVREFAMSAIYLYFLVQGNHARVAGTALLKIFLGATF